MKRNTAIKIKISIFLSIFLLIVSAIYFYRYTLNLFLGSDVVLYWDFFSLLLPLFSFVSLIFSCFILVFIFPYIKIASQSLLKRGLFFGIIVWIIDLPQILTTLQQAILTFDPHQIPAYLQYFIQYPLRFIIIGLVIGFCYKKWLPTEFNLSLKIRKVPFFRIIFAIILSALIYSLFMIFASTLIPYLARVVEINLTEVMGTFLVPLFYINPLIYGLIFILFYIKFIGRVDISKTKRWILFGFFLGFFTTPLILSPAFVVYEFFQHFTLMPQFLLIPHVFTIFVVGYFLTQFLNKRSNNSY